MLSTPRHLRWRCGDVGFPMLDVFDVLLYSNLGEKRKREKKEKKVWGFGKNVVTLRRFLGFPTCDGKLRKLVTNT